MLQSAVLMLHHIHEQETAERVQRALEKVYAEGKVLTRDVGGTSGTRAFADAVIAAMETAQTGPKGEETR
jgi:isocitrate dehydrogenase (NAD+)